MPSLTAALESIAVRRDVGLVLATAGHVPLPIRVDRPDEVGADRLVNALAAARLYGTPAVVVDLGHGVDLRRRSPPTGPSSAERSPRASRSGLDALAARTARLPRIELRTPDRAIARDTVGRDPGRQRSWATRPSSAGLLERIRRELADATGVDPGRDPGDPDRRPRPVAVGRGDRRDQHDRSRPDPQGPVDPARRGDRRRTDRGRPRMSGDRLEGDSEARGAAGRSLHRPRRHAARSRPTRPSSCCACSQAEGAEVQVLLTPTAARFVAPLTLEALSRRPVESDVLALLPDGRIGHIVDRRQRRRDRRGTGHGPLARRRWRTGLAGDVVTAACLATSAPVVVAPAMDGEMYAHPATRANVARLREAFGYTIVEPEAGPLASGQEGVGRLAELGRIVDAVVAAIGARPVRAPERGLGRRSSPGEPCAADLDGRHLIVTAGGTREAIDPVRFIGNRSTGRMGVAIASAALDRGARVSLIAAQRRGAACREAAELEPGREHGRARACPDERSSGARRGGPGELRRPGHGRGRGRLPAGPGLAPTKLSRGAGLNLELEPTPDLLAAARGRHPASSGPSRSSSASRPRPGSLARAVGQAPAQGRRPARGQRLSASPARASGRTRTG